jgi:hypothetical protein
MPGKPKDDFKLPKTLAECADALYNTKQARLAQQKVVEALEEKEKKLKQHLIDNLPKSQATGVAGKVARATITTKQVPTVTDWAEFWAGFNKKTDGDLLQRRLNESAVKARWEAKKTIKGVGTFTTVSVSLTKVGE